MGFRCGIVGLPNAGKSTLFNALTLSAAAQTASYPFTTVDANVGRVAVPDDRVQTVARLAGSKRVVPAQMEFVDIAGLVKGASRGEGLGNRFLAHIREMDAIVHVLRCFESGEVAHVEGSVEPLRDAEIVETELMLADLESLERRLEGVRKRARVGDEKARADEALIKRALGALDEGRSARTAATTPEEAVALGRLGLLTTKPVLYVCNVGESALGGDALTGKVGARAKGEGALSVVIAAALEAEVAEIEDADERQAFRTELGVGESGLARVIRAGYGLLGLISFFTANPNEAHAWTIRQGTPAVKAAGTVHSDFERGFIAAETVAYDAYVASGGERGAKETGRMRVEGRDYVVQDGDVIRFRFNV